MFEMWGNRMIDYKTCQQKHIITERNISQYLITKYKVWVIGSAVDEMNSVSALNATERTCAEQTVLSN
jgi:hypothetical protein